MTQLNCFNSTQKMTDAAPHIRLGGKSGIAVISGLLIGSLLAVGCSKERSTPASSESLTSASQTPSSQTPPTLPAPSSQTAAQAPAPKKVVKKRPTTVTYSDQTYGVSFRYPRKYTLKSGEEVKSVPGMNAMDFVQPGGMTAVAVELPKGSYPGTDLASAFFAVNVNKSLTAEECAQFGSQLPSSSEKDAAQPSKIEVGGMSMQEVEDMTATKQADTKYYHVFQNNACYEFALGLATEGEGSQDGITAVNREDVFRRLEKILASVKIKAEPAPEVVAGPAAVPAAQDGVVK